MAGTKDTTSVAASSLASADAQPDSRSDVSADSGSDSQHQLGSLWALATVAVVSAAGFGFWVLAAALSDTSDDVGRAAAWFTLSQLIVLLVGLGGPILINRTGSRANSSEIAGAAALTIFGAALVLGLVAPLIAGSAWRELSGVGGLSLGPFVAIGAGGAVMALVADARYLSLRKWRSVFIRNAAPALIRMPLLFINPFDDRATWIIVIAVAPLALSGAIAIGLLIRQGHMRLQLPWKLDADDRRFLLVQHFGAVAMQAPYHIVPLMVARRVAGPTNAAFYLVWSIGVMIALLPQTLTQVLLSETSLKTFGRLARIRRTMVANLVLAGGAWVGAVILGRPVLNLIGPDYGEIAPVLPWIVLSAAALSVTSICLTEARLARNGRITTLVAVTLATIAIGLGWILIEQRAVWGATMSWLIANIVAMLAGIIALERTVRGTGEEDAVSVPAVGDGLTESALTNQTVSPDVEPKVTSDINVTGQK